MEGDRDAQPEGPETPVCRDLKGVIWQGTGTQQWGSGEAACSSAEEQPSCGGAQPGEVVSSPCWAITQYKQVLTIGNAPVGAPCGEGRCT